MQNSANNMPILFVCWSICQQGCQSYVAYLHPLSQYVNLAKTLPCLSQPPPAAVRDKFIFCPFCPSSPPDQPFADPISAAQVPRPRDRRLLFCGFLLRLVSGLNHPLAPQIWRWGGPGVREGNARTQSTKLEDGIKIVKYTFLAFFWTLLI